MKHVKDYIYTLGYNGTVFYVGRSGNVTQRYKMHIANTMAPSYPLIYQNLLIGVYPELKIVDHTFEDNGGDLERGVMDALIKNVFRLTNCYEKNRSPLLLIKPKKYKKIKNKRFFLLYCEY